MNVPTVPQRRAEPEAAAASIPHSRTQSPSEVIPEQSGSATKHANPLSIRRYAQVVRKTAWRLTSTVREATADGALGSTEITRMHMWVTADLVPWALESVELVDEAAKRQATALIDEIRRLDSELSASIGEPAAEIAEQLRKTGSAIVSVLVSDN